MSEILESVLHTVQKQLTYRQYHYILTDLYRWQCAIYTYIYSVHTDILEGGKLTSNNVAGSSHNPLQSFAVASGAVSKPGGDAAGQDALHSAGVEWSEDAGAHSKLPQPSQEEEVLMWLLQHCICVSGPCEILGDVNAEELKAVYPAPQVSCRWWWVCVLCSVSWNPPPASWSCRPRV